MKYLEIFGTFVVIACFLIYPICGGLGLIFAGFSDHREAWDTPIHHTLATIPWIVIAVGLTITLLVGIFDITVKGLDKIISNIRRKNEK